LIQIYTELQNEGIMKMCPQ